MAKVGGYVPTAEQLAAQKARRAAQQAEKAARKASKYGGKTVLNPNPTGKYDKFISMSKEAVKEAAEKPSYKFTKNIKAVAKKMTKKLKTFGQKVSSYAKANPGKTALIAAGAVALLALVTSNKSKD